MKNLIIILLTLSFSLVQNIPAFAAFSIYSVSDSHPRYQQLSPAFIGLGSAFEVGGLIWSGVAPDHLRHWEAIKYCRDVIGGGARLPTQRDYLMLSHALGSRDPIHDDYEGYSSGTLPEMTKKVFWSATAHPDIQGGAFHFNGSTGSVSRGSIGFKRSIRCVR